MIFIIAGKADAGKDTTAKFIKENVNKKTLNIQFSKYIKDYAKNISDWDGLENNKPRELLQELGTNIKNNIDELFFVKRVIDDIKIYSNYFDVITISDTRYKTEIEEIKKVFNNTYSIYVKRPNYDNGLTESEKNHPTEKDLDDYNNFDFVINNDKDLNNLNNEVINILNKLDLR